MNKKASDKLIKIAKEYINIKYKMVLIEKIYKKELITSNEYEALMKKYEKELEKCYRKGEKVWKKEK